MNKKLREDLLKDSDHLEMLYADHGDVNGIILPCSRHFFHVRIPYGSRIFMSNVCFHISSCKLRAEKLDSHISEVAWHCLRDRKTVIPVVEWCDWCLSKILFAKTLWYRRTHPWRLSDLVCRLFWSICASFHKQLFRLGDQQYEDHINHFGKQFEGLETHDICGFLEYLNLLFYVSLIVSLSHRKFKWEHMRISISGIKSHRFGMGWKYTFFVLNYILSYLSSYLSYGTSYSHRRHQ